MERHVRGRRQVTRGVVRYILRGGSWVTPEATSLRAPNKSHSFSDNPGGLGISEFANYGFRTFRPHCLVTANEAKA